MYSEDGTIPKVYVLSIEKRMNNSSNAVFPARGKIITTAEEIDIVVKLNNNERITKPNLTRELLALYIGKQLDILTPIPLVALITKELVLSIEDPIIQQMFMRSIGETFATVYLENVTTTGAFINSKEDDLELLKILVFDLLIENPDRRYNNPNLLIKKVEGKNNYYIIDHETSFSFIDLIFQGEPGTSDLHEVVKNHVLLNICKKIKHIDLSFLAKYETINDDFWFKVKSSFPENLFDEPTFEKIKKYINLRIKNIDYFIYQIKGVLS